MRRSRRSLLTAAAVLVIATLAGTVLGDAQCYGINGQKSGGSPCNNAATGQPGSHASCCDESKQEACLASGLCYAAQRNDNNTFWSEGCTDPTGLDPSCPQYCGASSQFISPPFQTTYTMLFCGSGSWCCCFDSFGKTCNKADCCTRNFTLAAGLGRVVRQFTANGDAAIAGGAGASSGNGSSSSGGGGGRDSDGARGSRLITAIVGGALGSLLLASLVAFGFSFSRNRQLRRQVEFLQAQNAKTASTMLTTQGLLPLNMAKEDMMSPISYERTRTPSNSFHQGGGGGTPTQGFAGFNFPPPTRTPSTPGATRRPGGGGGGSTAELAGPFQVSELPADKYMG